MRRKTTKEVTVPWRIVVPLGLVVAVAGIAGIGMAKLADTPPPEVLSVEHHAALVEPSGNPYTLASLLERLPPDAVAKVGRYLDYYQKKKHRGLQGGLARSTRYLAIYQEIFRKSGLPEELAYLPLIESGFVESATSHAQAVGVWQFTAETGRRFNLQANDYFDRRRDPITSAHAAARYLKVLHRKFNNWDLALAAYNSGAGTVNWAQRVNRKAKLPTDYWSLTLPEETMNYVPAFIASVLIAKNPDAFGFRKIRFQPQIAYERMKVSPGISLASLAIKMEVEEDALFSLNPELLQGTTPPGASHYLLRVPPGKREVLRGQVASGETKMKDWVLHRVQTTDTLQTLAARFQAQPHKILKVNGIQGDTDLIQREYLIIPL